MNILKTKRIPIGYGVVTILTVLACLAAYLTALLRSVESVLGTGPAIAVLAGVLWAMAAKHHHPPGIRIAYFILTFLFSLTLLTWIADWAPNEAYVPFVVLGSGFIVTVLVLSNRSFGNAPNRYEEWQCLNCGYPLYGLTTNRCPECGNEINAALVEKYRNQDPIKA